VNASPDEHIGHAVRRIEELRALERLSTDLRERCKNARSTGRCVMSTGIADAGVGHPDHRTAPPALGPRALIHAALSR
jgi:hypothetical protein